MFQSLRKPVVLRNIFLVLFLVSSLVLIVLTVSEFGLIKALGQVSPSPSDNPSVETPPRTSEGIGFTVVGSVITSVISLVGFVITTTITWRKEKREASLADVERKKLEVELEKSRLELEEMKKSAEKKEKS